MKKMLFIMNPCAGMKKAKRYFMQIIELFNRSGYRVTTHITGGKGDAAQVAEELAGEMDAIVCCGGDGTFNETLSGVMAAGTDTPIGYIPAGSTNDFATSLHLPTGILEAAKFILEGEPVAYDVGVFGDRNFCYVASFGAFTKTSYATPQNVKNALGHTAYLLGGIQELSQLRHVHMRLEVDDRVLEDNYLFGAISNSTSVGGILTLDPKRVDLADGKFEVLLVRAPKDLLELPDCIRALQTQQYNCGMITFCTASHVRALGDPSVVWTLDGERAEGQACIEIQNLHKAIRVMRKG